MFRRKAMDGLLKWRSKREHRCLLVEGPRGIGKTTLIREFAKTYEHSVRFDMRGDEAARRIFDRTPDVDGLVDAMGILRPGSDISPGNTLIVLDEIQHCPRARCALKSFSEDGRYDVVAAGSFPGVPLRVDDRSDPAARIPIGYERHLRMHGMDFEEFLWAVGFDEAQTAAIRMSVRDREPLPTTVLDACQGLFDRFMAVGGLPEAVSAFVSGEGMERVSRIQRDAALAFEDDAVAYAPESYARRIPICFDSVPSQLTGVDKRFMWSRIGGDGSGQGTARRYEHALWWMADAGVVHRCHGLSGLEAPVCIGKQQSRFKVYMSDTGMLTGMLGPDALHAARSKDDSFGHGALTENIVAECLMKTGVEPHYCIDEGCPDGMGPDFVVGLGLETAAIGVGSWKTPSLSKTLGDDRIQRRIVFGRSNIHVDENGIEHYPLFAAAFIKDIAKPLPKIDLRGRHQHDASTIPGMYLAAADLGSCMFVISAGIVYDGFRYLCFRKGEAKYPYLSHRYEFPGGKVEAGETPEQALVREFSEELELSIDIGTLRPVGEVRYSYPDFDVLIHAFLVPMDSCEPVLTEHEYAGWFGRGQLRDLDWVEADKLIVDLLEDSL